MHDTYWNIGKSEYKILHGIVAEVAGKDLRGLLADKKGDERQHGPDEHEAGDYLAECRVANHARPAACCEWWRTLLVELVLELQLHEAREHIFFFENFFAHFLGLIQLLSHYEPLERLFYEPVLKCFD